MFKVFTIIAIISYNILINLLKKRISDMSLLTVTGLTHGFGDRAIFNNVSFQLNRLDKIGLVGANGEGKSTFMNIITGKLMPDEGKVEWAKNVRVGYLDQHAVLEKGMTIQSVLASAFDFLYDMENQMNEIYAGLGDASPEEMDKLMAEAGTIQDLLTMHDFYMIDAKVEEVARALGLSELGLDKDVTELSGGQRTKVLLGKLLLEKPDILLLDEPTNYLDENHIEWLKRYLIECDLSSEFFSELDKKNGASMIAKILIEDCTELHMFVGTAANSAYQNPGMAFDLGIRQNLVKQLKEAVEGMGKKVTVTYY